MASTLMPLRGMTSESLAVAGGRKVTVRPIVPADQRALQRFVERLSACARRLRFHLALNGLSDAAARWLTAVDQQAHVALVAETSGPQAAAEIVADARYSVNEDGRSAECAIVVADDWNGRGLGRALFLKLMLRAQEQGLERLTGEVLADNRRVQALVGGLGGEIRPHSEEAALVVAEFSLSGRRSEPLARSIDM